MASARDSPGSREAHDRSRLVGEIAANAQHVARLEAEHAGIVAASRESNADDEHDPEGTTIAYERQQVVALLAQARRTSDALVRSLEDLDDGRYGICEQCGKRIPAERLEARPNARTCRACAT